MENCWLIHPNIVHNRAIRRSPEASLLELKSLAKAINLKILYSDIFRVSILKSGTFFGKGRISLIFGMCDRKFFLFNVRYINCIKLY